MKGTIAVLIIIMLLAAPFNSAAAIGAEVDNMNNFALKLFNILANENETFCVSPSSLYSALGMLYLGSAGETKSEIGTLLGQKSDDDLKQVQKYISGMHRQGSNNGERQAPEFVTAQKLWVDNSFILKPSYIKELSDVYSAEIESLSFDDGAVARINDWVRDKTHGKISRITDQLPNDAVLLMIDALYFKGAWETAFNDQNNTQEKFYGAKTQQEITMMHNTAMLDYFNNGKFQSVSLPVFGSDMRCIIILPGGNYDPEFANNLSVSDINDINRSSTVENIQLSLPKNNINSTFEDLTAVLQSLGMRYAFYSGAADLSAMSDNSDGLFVSKILQKTTFSTDENGIEASAATAISIARSMMIIDPPVEMTVDRPYIIVLQDAASGIIHFIANVTQVN